MQRNLKRAVELEKRAWRTREGRREGERERVRKRGRGRKTRREAERQTDGGEACSSREEEKQSVLTEEVCMPCGPCAQVSPIYSFNTSARFSHLQPPSLCFCLPEPLSKKMTISNNIRYDFHCCLVFKDSTFFTHLLVITHLFQFFSPMQCCVMGFTVPLLAEVFFSI